MLVENSIVDGILAYKVIQKLTTPFEKTKAFSLGIIDHTGKKLRDPKTSEERESYTYLDKLAFNLKKILESLPGGKSQLASYAAALYLMRESNNPTNPNEKTLIEVAKGLLEDAPTNSGGAAVAGTESGEAWKKDNRKPLTKNRSKRDRYRRLGIYV